MRRKTKYSHRRPRKLQGYGGATPDVKKTTVRSKNTRYNLRDNTKPAIDPIYDYSTRNKTKTINKKNKNQMNLADAVNNNPKPASASSNGILNNITNLFDGKAATPAKSSKTATNTSTSMQNKINTPSNSNNLDNINLDDGNVGVNNANNTPVSPNSLDVSALEKIVNIPSKSPSKSQSTSRAKSQATSQATSRATSQAKPPSNARATSQAKPPSNARAKPQSTSRATSQVNYDFSPLGSPTSEEMRNLASDPSQSMPHLQSQNQSSGDFSILPDDQQPIRSPDFNLAGIPDVDVSFNLGSQRNQPQQQHEPQPQNQQQQQQQQQNQEPQQQQPQPHDYPSPNADGCFGKQKIDRRTGRCNLSAYCNSLPGHNYDYKTRKCKCTNFSKTTRKCLNGPPRKNRSKDTKIYEGVINFENTDLDVTKLDNNYKQYIGNALYIIADIFNKRNRPSTS